MKTKTLMCPKCGKAMAEQPKFAGLWICPDYVEPLNKRPPFRYKCKGMVLTDAGAAAMDEELRRRYVLHNN